MFAEDKLKATGMMSPRTLNFVGLAIIAVAGLLLCAVPMLPNYYIRVINLVLVYVLLGTGLNIVVGYAGLFDLGYVAFYAIGAYCYALLAGPQFGLHFPLLPVIAIAAALGALAGILLGIPVLRLRGDYLAIVTLGFGEIIRIFLNNLDHVTNGPKGLTNLDRATLFGMQLRTPSDFYWLLLAMAILIGVFVFRVERSILGKAWLALREDQQAAVGIGIDKTRLKLVAFAMSATIGSITGVVFAAFQRFVSPESFTLQESILVVLVIVIGGIGNIVGVIVGAAVLIVVPELLREYAQYRMLIFGSALVIVILMRPGGIVPARWSPDAVLRRLVWR